MRVRNIAMALVAAATMSFAAPALAANATAEAGDWQIRIRALGVIPIESANVTGLTGSIEISDNWQPEIDFTYFISSNWSVELIAATTQHDVMATAGVDLGTVWLLPPTLLLQYRVDTSANWQPYVGAGLNYTVFYNEETPGGFPINYDDAFGFAAQVGVDIMLDEHWLLNLDVKKIWLSTDVSVMSGAVRANVDINPWVLGVGFGYRF